MAQPNRSISFVVIAAVAAVVVAAAVAGLAGLASAVRKNVGGAEKASLFIPPPLFFPLSLLLLSHVRARPELDRRH